jgi:hypothetical protein
MEYITYVNIEVFSMLIMMITSLLNPIKSILEILLGWENISIYLIVNIIFNIMFSILWIYDRNKNNKDFYDNYFKKKNGSYIKLFIGILFSVNIFFDLVYIYNLSNRFSIIINTFTLVTEIIIFNTFFPAVYRNYILTQKKINKLKKYEETLNMV